MTTPRLSVVAAACIAPALVLVSGCESSAWQREFVPAARDQAAPAYSGPVKIREVPWERVQQTLAELHQEWVQSDAPPEEWPQSRKDERKSKLLRGLQVTTEPEQVTVLGRSEFRSTDRIRPRDGELASFARQIGATTVVWSSAYMGKADVLRSEPVTEYRSGSFTPWRGESSPSRTFSETSTVFVPVVLQADERAWVAYFLREAPEVAAGR